MASSEDGMVLEKDAVQKKGAGEGEVAAPPSAAEGDPSVVRWEKCLPRMVLRVLLVEADDSTRQIITALLRKCSYIGLFEISWFWNLILEHVLIVVLRLES